MKALKKITNAAGWPIALLMILFSVQANAQLSGTYTIDPSGSGSTNFPSFTAAVDTLTNDGVSGAVVFNVASGTYTEQISIGSISGASSTNTITFQSKAGDSSKVILEYASNNSGSSYTVLSISGSYITFSRMSIMVTGTGSYGQAVSLSSSSHISFLHDQIFSVVSSNYNYYCRAANCNYDSKTVFYNNHIKGGNYGIYVQGSSNRSVFNNLTVDSNMIDSFYYNAFYGTDVNKFVFNNNYVTNSTNTSYNYPIMLYYCDSGFSISNNMINMPTTGYFGLYMYDNVESSNDPGIVSNNMISLGLSNSYGNGIFSESNQYISFFYNSILLYPVSGTASNSYDMQLYYNTANSFYDNILSNTANGYNVYEYSGIDTMDYNDLYTTGSYVGYYNGSNEATLSDWNSASGYDANSISTNPYFISNINLLASAPQLAAGTPISGITTDIFGNTRSTTTPDMGAYEFKVVSLDAGVLSIDSPGLGSCAGTHSVYVTLRNYGLNTITSATINWSVNGTAKTAVSISSAYILSGNDSSGIYLGTMTLPSGTPVSIKAWTTSPNGGTDGNDANDTANGSVSSALSGTFTIGGTSPDYATFSDALKAIYSNGICGKVVFNVRSGTYNENLNLKPIAGSSASNSITFQSATGDSSAVILTNQNNTTVTFNGASYVNFKEMTIANGNNGNQNVYISNGSSYDSISHCLLRSGYQYSEMIYMQSYSSPYINYITINNCAIHGGGYSIYTYLNYNSPGVNENIVITGNIIDSFNYSAILSYYADSLVVSHNLIQNPSGTSSNGITLYDAWAGDAYIFGNKFIFPSGGNSGIYMDYLQNGSTSTPMMIYNNFISIGGSNQSYGIDLEYGCQNFFFDYNNIDITSSNSNSAGIYNNIGGTLNSSPYGINFVDNISSNTGGGYAVYVSSGYVDTMDYNDYYVPSTSSYLGYWTGSYAASLSDWQSYSGLDANSVSADPAYNNNSNLTPSSSALYKAGSPVYGITTDINGKVRNASTPDIGAVEFKPYNNDAGVVSIDSPSNSYCSSGTLQEYVTIRNAGLSTLTSVKIYFSVNGGTASSYSWTGSLASSATAQVNVGSGTFGGHTPFNLKAYTSKPNGVADSNSANDTAVSSVTQGISGTYTIGGVTPDFATFTDAITALSTYGFCGNVIFNVRDGIYNENLTFNGFANSSPSATVTFQGASGDSSKVILENNSTVVNFTSASYINFKDMTIENIGSSYAVNFNGGSSYDSFSHCIIRVNYMYSYNVYMYGYGNPNSYNVFNNCAMHGGYYSVYSYGNYTTPYQTGNTFKGNIIDSFYYYGISSYYDDSLVISGNLIENPTYNGGYGVWMYQPYNYLYIYKNKFVFPNGIGGAIQPYYTYNLSSSTPGMIYNNFISIGGSGSSFGYYPGYYTEYVNFDYNNINITNTGSNSSGIYLSNYIPNGLNFEDNISVNTGGGYAVYVSSSSYVDTMNYNDWYVPSTSSYLGYWSGTYAADLSSWQSASSQDGNSVSVDPAYSSSTNLTPNNSTLYHAGTPVYGITDDINGKLRNTTTPNIGAVEFKPIGNDAGVVSIDSPGAGFCPGTMPVYITFRNFGLNTMTSVKIDWSVNGTSKTSYSWTGSLASGSAAQVQLGTLTFAANTLYNIKAYTSKPNGVVDSNANNDTFMSGVSNGLSGTYTIGGSSPDFATFAAADSAILIHGLCGSVVFNVRKGTYSEKLNIGAIVGVSALKTVTFQGATGDSSQVNLTWSGSNTLTLSGASYVNFRGITISNTGSSSPVYITGGSSYDSISHCVIRSGYQYTQTVYIYGYGGSNQYITVNNCAIHGGEMGVYAYGNYTTPYQFGTVITGNTIDSFYYYGVYSYYADSLVISNNVISNPWPSGYDYYGIQMYFPRQKFYIFKNKIDLPTAQYGSYGIYFYYGYYLSSSYTSQIFDNFITISNGSYSSYGIYAYYLMYTDLVFNSINITNTGTSSSGIELYYGGSSLYAENNISVNTGGGYAVASNYVSGMTMNYNDWYVPSTSSYLGIWSGSTDADLSAWQSSSSQDASSVSGDPAFVSAIDLTPSSAIVYNDGTPITNDTTDIFGKIRNASTPCIGAVEFKPLHNDAGVVSIDSPGAGFCAGKLPVYATFRNFGLDTITSITIDWSVNGTAQTAQSWTGTVYPGQKAQVLLGSLTFAANTLYNIQAYTYQPNGTTDGNDKNDSFSAGVENGMSGTYTIGGTSPDFNTFSDAIKAVTTKGLCSSVIFNVRTGTYSENFTLTAITGLSPTKTITFQSASGDSSKVNITSTNGSGTVIFNGASYINFKNITISNTGSGYPGCAVYFTNSSYDSISHCVLRATYQYGDGALYFYGYGSANKYVTVNNSAIHAGGYYAVFSEGSYNTPYQFGDRLTGNVIDSFYYYGIFAIYDDSLVIDHNLITNTNSNAYEDYGMYLEEIRNQIYVFDNKITFPTVASGGGSGIYFTYAFYMSSSTPALVYNNFVSYGSNGNSSTVYGIQAGYYANYMDVFFNSVNISNTSSYSAGLYNYAYYGGSGLEYEDNVSVNTGGGFAVSLATSSYSATFNYNDYYVTGSYLGNWSGSYQSDLSSWQSASSQDANSLSVDPNFASLTDLHPHAISLYKSGTPISGIPNDIDGTVRNATYPTMGAAEYFPAANVLAVSAILSPAYASCGDSSTSVTIVLNNNGSANQTSVPVYAVITGATSATLKTTVASITAGSSDTITFTTKFNTYAGGIYKLTCYASDTFQYNDTLVESVFISEQSPSPTVTNGTSCSAGKVTLSATPGNSADSIYWYASSSGGTPITSGTSFSTPSISKTTVYYAQESSRRDVYSDGPTSLSIGSYTGTSYAGIEFDVTTPITIDSATVYPSGTGDATFTLRDSLGNVIGTSSSSVSVLFAYTAVRVPVGIKVGTGHNFTLTMDGSTCGGFYYNSSGGSYPYTVKKVMSITNTSDNQGSSGYYSGPYDILLHTGDCASGLVAVTATIGAPTASFSKDASSGGKFNKGTSANPDQICAGSTFIYDLTTNFTNASYGSAWDVNAYSLKTAHGTAASSFSFTKPTSTTAGEFTYNAQTSEIDSVFILSVDVKDAVKGCDTVITRYITVPSLSKIAIGPAFACLNSAETFSDTGSAKSDTLTWDFGDGSASVKGATPSHTYTTSGSYTVKLTITNAAGCTNTGSTSVTVNNPPSAAFGASNVGCPNQIVQFNDSSVAYGTDNVVGWHYNFGDGNSSSSQNPSHQYTKAGNDTITLMVTSSKGCTSTAKRVITIQSGPTAAFTTNTACVGDSTYFSNTSKSASGATYTWYFGDLSSPVTTTLATGPAHLYAAGTYTASVKVSVSGGCSDSVANSVTVNPRPTAAITAPATGCTGVPVTINDATITSTSLTYNWTFGDGGSSTNGNNSHAYATAGTYTITNRIQVVGGCSDSISQTITIYASPTANFVHDSTCVASTTHFRDTSSGSSLTYSWNFGDGIGTSSLQDPNYTYATTGKYTVTETVSTPSGCSSKASQVINVHTLPHTTFTYSATTAAVVTFKQSDTSNTYAWNFGDNSTSTLKNPVHSYSAPKGSDFYLVSLTTTSPVTGCSSLDTETINLVVTGINNTLAQDMNMLIAPNPFSDQVRVEYTLPQAQDMRISIYDITGKEIAVVANSHQDAGKYVFNIEASKYNMGAGIYFLHIIAGSQATDEKIIRLK